MTYTSINTNKSGETRRSDQLAHSFHGKVKAIAPAMMQRA